MQKALKHCISSVFTDGFVGRLSQIYRDDDDHMQVSYAYT